MNALTSFLNHIIHGDRTEVMPTMPRESIDLVVTDPPFLVNYRPRDGRTVTGDRNNAWLFPSFAEAYRLLKPNTFCVSFYGWPHPEVPAGNVGAILGGAGSPTEKDH